MFKEDKQSRRLRQADAEYVAAIEAGVFPEGPRPQRVLEIYQAIHSGDSEQELIGCKMARNLSCGPVYSPMAIDAFIDSGILAKCVKLLKKSNHETQLEVVLMVRKIVGFGDLDHLRHLVELRVVNLLVQLVNSKHYGLVEQALFSLGLIASDCAYTRELVMKTEVFTHLVFHAKSSTSPTTLLENITWVCYEFYGGLGEQKPSLQKFKQMLSALENLLKTTDVGVITNTCIILWRLALDGSNRMVKEVLNTDGLLVQLVRTLNSTDNQIVAKCLDAIEHLLRRGKNQTNRLMDAGPLIQILGRLMESTETDIARRAIWIVASIVATTREQVNRVITGGLVPILCKVIQTGTDYAKREPVRIIWTIARTGASDHIAHMCQNGVIPAICSTFTISGSGSYFTVQPALKTLQIILDSAEQDFQKIEEYCKAVEECGGRDSLEQLLVEHSNWKDEIYHIAYDIVSIYFHKLDQNDDDRDADDGDVKPAKAQKLE